MKDPNDPGVKKLHRHWDDELAFISLIALASLHPLIGMTTFHMCGFTNCAGNPNNTNAGSHDPIMLTLLGTAALLVVGTLLLTLTRIVIGRRRFYAVLSYLKQKTRHPLPRA